MYCFLKCLDLLAGFYDDNSEAEIEWIPTTGNGLTKPYFDNLDETFLDEEDSYQVRTKVINILHSQ